MKMNGNEKQFADAVRLVEHSPRLLIACQSGVKLIEMLIELIDNEKVVLSSRRIMDFMNEAINSATRGAS